MERLFKRHFWIFHVLFVALVAVMLARTTNHVAAAKVAQFLEASGQGGKKAAPRPPRADARNFDEAGEYNIFGAMRENVSPLEVDLIPACETDADCDKGSRCVAVENPAPGEPAKQCQRPELTGEPDFANAVLSELPLKLVGTSVFSYPEDSLASIIDNGKGRNAEAELYSINKCEPVPATPPRPAKTDGDEDADEEEDPEKHLRPKAAPCNKLLDVHTLVRIDVDRVYLLNSEENRYEYLSLEEESESSKKVSRAPKRKKKDDNKSSKRSSRKGDSLDEELAKGVTKTGPNSYEVKQEQVTKALTNLSKLATKARIVPAFEGGEAIGFKLFSIRPGSIYSKLGIQNGDIITKVNGYDISSPDKALTLFNKLKDGKEFAVDIKRRGKPVSLEYSITP